MSRDEGEGALAEKASWQIDEGEAASTLCGANYGAIVQSRNLLRSIRGHVAPCAQGKNHCPRRQRRAPPPPRMLLRSAPDDRDGPGGRGNDLCALWGQAGAPRAPQLPTAVRAPLGAPRMSGMHECRAPGRSARRRVRLDCSVGRAQHVCGEWGARCCNVTGQPIPAWSGIGCQQCWSGVQALAAGTLAIVLSCWPGPGGATRPLVRMFRPPGLVRS